MKTDEATAELPGIPQPPKKRGRPKKPDAASNAERQAAYRDRRKKDGFCPCCGQRLPEIAA